MRHRTPKDLERISRSSFDQDLLILTGGLNLPDDDTPPRNAFGRFVRSNAYHDSSIESEVIEAAFERWIAQEFAHTNARPNADLGQHRMSHRQAQDARRERERVNTCLICAREFPRGTRSGKDTCSSTCRQRKKRMTEAAIHDLKRQRDAREGRVSKVAGDKVAPPSGHGSAPGMEVLVGPKRQLSPLTVALLEAIEEVWRVAMPLGYPDEVEWRRGQTTVLYGLLRDERALGRSSVATFKRRARSYIRSQARLSAANARKEP